MPDLSPEAKARATRTVEVAEVFAAHADQILEALADVPAGHVLVAVVDDEHDFSGVHHVHTETMVERVPQLEGDGGWAMVFPPGSTREDLVRRTSELAHIASARIAAIDRITSRRATGDERSSNDQTGNEQTGNEQTSTE